MSQYVGPSRWPLELMPETPPGARPEDIAAGTQGATMPGNPLGITAPGLDPRAQALFDQIRSNPVGTNQLYPLSMDRPSPSLGTWEGVHQALAPAPNTTYASAPYMPIAKDQTTGELRLALPESLRTGLRGMADLLQGPGAMQMWPGGVPTLTPEATMALTAPIGGEVEEGTLAALRGRMTPEGFVNRAGVLIPHNVGRIVEPQLLDQLGNRISTRTPDAVGLPDPHTTQDMFINAAAMRADPESWRKNADIVRSYPGLQINPRWSDDAVMQAFQEHLEGNIRGVWDEINRVWPQDTVRRAMLWYDGGNAITNRWAQQYGYQPRQIAGSTAALSPQTPWDMNVSMEQRLLDTVHNQGDTITTPAMRSWILDQYVPRMIKDKRPQGAIDEARAGADAIAGRPLGAIEDPWDRALWIRAWDETNNPRTYQLVTPEGGFAGTALTAAGRPDTFSWMSLTAMERALKILDDGSLANISRMAGDAHKVRNFYNNLEAPNAPFGDITSDTHNIALGLLRPLGSSVREVSQGLGQTGSASNATGASGLYGIYADAMRNVAQELGLQPRQLQSPTWEGLRGLFSPESRRDKAFGDRVLGIWNDHANGRTNADQARRNIFDAAGGIDAPAWAGLGR